MIRTSGKYHKKPNTVWLIYYLKKSNVPSLSWNGAVDEALCFSWIDSTQKKINDFSFMQFFSKRKPKSNWSKKNAPYFFPVPSNFSQRFPLLGNLLIFLLH